MLNSQYNSYIIELYKHYQIIHYSLYLKCYIKIVKKSFMKMEKLDKIDIK